MGELLGTNISVSDPGFSAVSYDGVWALALGMHDVQHEIAGGLANYTYGDETYAKKVGRSILNQKFAGMSIRLDKFMMKLKRNTRPRFMS